MSINTLYKCRAKLNDEYGNLAVNYDKFKVIGQTKEYYIIKTYCKKGSKKVQKDSKNGYAFDTKEKALFNFLKRRERYQGFLEHFIRQNKQLIDTVSEILGLSEEECDCEDYENGLVSNFCEVHNENPYKREDQLP